MAVKDVLKSFNLNTETLPDKVIWRTEQTYSVPLAPGITAYTEYTIPHGLPFVPLILGTYSDDDFATSYDFGVGPYGNLPTYGFDGFTMIAHAYSDATNVTIRVISHNTARTITFRLVGLVPQLSPATTIPTPTVQDDFILNSDLITLKHITVFSVNMTTNGLGTFVTHAYATQLSTPATSLCFITEGGKTSFMNTMNAITRSGVNFATLSKPNTFTLAVEDTIVTTVAITVKIYADA
jgi:hypothetical protein